MPNMYYSAAHTRNSTHYTSNVLRNFFTAGSSIPPPSGSTASIHRAIATTCPGSFAVIHTLPLVPTADSNGMRDPSKGSKKYCGSSNLSQLTHEQNNKKMGQKDTYNRHILRLQCTRNPPLSSPNPSAFRVWASKHSSSGSISLCARDTRA